MNRLDRRPDDQLIKRITDLEANLQTIKTAQTLGSSSVRPARIYSAAAYDIEVASIGFNNRVVEVVFTPSDTTFDNLSAVWKMAYTETYSSGGALPSVLERLVPSGNTQVWRIYLEGSDSTPITWGRLKFYFFANGGGTFTATLL